jgi:L-2-hydroxyglutarate oxidase LhgO
METVDCVVVGAGVIGLAVARALAQSGREVIVLEAEAAIGTQGSSRNSEVIHAGIYDSPDSLKARLCVRGRRQLYDYCAEHGVAHRRCGKLIVATSAREADQLGGIGTRAEANGVEGLCLLSAAEARGLEPDLSCTGALLSPATGIIDSHGLMLALQGDAEAAGTVIALRSPLTGGRIGERGIELAVGGAEPTRLCCRLLVNAAGLHASDVVARLAGFPKAWVTPTYYAKGSYFTLAGPAPFTRLIYPVPEPGGLGVHLTFDLAGQVRFGPDVEWVERLDFSVDPARGERFYAAVRRYWPALRDGALQPGYAGIRPKLAPPGAPGRDFVVQGPSVHGVGGLINLFGIESPGLTACLALAELVRDLAAVAT